LTSKEKLAALLPKDAVHQGIALNVQTLHPLDLSDLLHSDEPNQILVILDQVSDPHNIGCNLRTAAVLEQKPDFDGSYAPKKPDACKISLGALEMYHFVLLKTWLNHSKISKRLVFGVAFAEEPQNAQSNRS